MKVNFLKTNPKQNNKSKYGNLITEYNGHTFDSKKEANYAMQLDFMKKASKPSERVIEYEMQVPFPVVVNGAKICKYIADFKVIYADGRVEIIDVKGVRTNVYTIKKKLVEALHDVKIIEV